MATSSRLVVGALAGMVATAPMTSAMRRLHRRLNDEDRYALPPREIISSVAPRVRGAAAQDLSMAAHFAYGGLCGAALALGSKRPSLITGAACGLGIWLASYLGWIPALGILKPAARHPAPRNKLMIASHIVWGVVYAIAQNEIIEGQAIMKGAPLKDVGKPT